MAFCVCWFSCVWHSIQQMFLINTNISYVALKLFMPNTTTTQINIDRLSCVFGLFFSKFSRDIDADFVYKCKVCDILVNIYFVKFLVNFHMCIFMFCLNLGSENVGVCAFGACKQYACDDVCRLGWDDIYLVLILFIYIYMYDFVVAAACCINLKVMVFGVYTCMGELIFKKVGFCWLFVFFFGLAI